MGLSQMALNRVAALPDRVLTVVLGGHAAGSDEGAARLAFWQAATGHERLADAALEAQLARDILALRGQLSPDSVLARRGPMLARAAASLRAAAAPATEGLRRRPAPDDVAVTRLETPFAGFFSVEVRTLSFRRFDGTQSPALRREVFVACDAVTVLPYDPARDRILLVEQLRAGPLARDEANPWQLEAVAGRVDADETPQAAARRECAEEAGLKLRHLEPVAEYYPSPGAFTEYLYSYVGLCDLPDGVAGVHGMVEESEDIRGHLLPWTEALALLDAGAFTNAPLILTLHWLARHRDRLRRADARTGI